MKKAKFYFVLAVTSGNGCLEVAWVVVTSEGETLEEKRLGYSPDHAAKAGVEECDSPLTVRNRFWAEWERWRDRGAMLVAECLWPTEAIFMSQCMKDDLMTRAATKERHPWHDLATLALEQRKDPFIEMLKPRTKCSHDPLSLARSSAARTLELIGGR